MEILPSGDLRIVFSGPFRLVETRLDNWTVLDTNDVRDAAGMVNKLGLLTVRPPANDQSALSVFDLAGTTTSPFPIELIVALDLPLAHFESKLTPCMKPFLGRSSPFSSFRVAAVVVRLFGNGLGAVVLTIDLKARRSVEQESYNSFLKTRFANDSATLVALKGDVRAILQEALSEVCAAIVRYSSIKDDRLDGSIHFLTTFFVLSADWDDTGSPDLRLTSALRPLLQPKAGEALANQSNGSHEFVMYTSGVHIYVWNRRHKPDHTSRTIALVSFLSLMNILWAELEFVKGHVMKMIQSRRVPLWVPTDLDERLEILYNQIMVVSVSWRSDFSSFRDEVDRRWRISQLKDYCFSLIATAESRSAKKRGTYLTWGLATVTVAQIVSVLEDGLNLYDRFFGTGAPLP